MKSFPNILSRPTHNGGGGGETGAAPAHVISPNATVQESNTGDGLGLNFRNEDESASAITTGLISKLEKNEIVNPNQPSLDPLRAKVTDPLNFSTAPTYSSDAETIQINTTISDTTKISASATGTGSVRVIGGGSPGKVGSMNNDTIVDNTNTKLSVAASVKAGRSLFNAYYTIASDGIAEGIPTMDSSGGIDTTDCSISHLVKLSSQKNSILGQARYKYADFMYCKELGKMSNNHLITLRVFADPVQDNIFQWGCKSNDQAGDIGRLVTWFGTEDNKLESILHYNFNAKWKELNAKFAQEASQENDAARGFLGQASNWRTNATLGAEGGMSLKIGNTSIDAPYENNDAFIGKQYDQNVVYEPADTIRSTHIYDGELVFNHEFTLTFNYKLRSYSGVNPKTAFLDLIGNVLAVTYRRGSFWGGENQILGAQPDDKTWASLTAINESVAKGIDSIFNSGTNANIEQIAKDTLTALANDETIKTAIAAGIDITGKLKQAYTDVKTMISSGEKFSVDRLKGITSETVGGITNTILGAGKALGVDNMAKAFTGNKIGRPAIYAFNTLLTGAPVGKWHVTIGNPLNPIAAFGNLIITNTEITHLGPLGFDDFPTELKVSVTLKHARARDSVEIGKMYTKGLQAIYFPVPSADSMGLNDTTELKVSLDESSNEAYGRIGDFDSVRIKHNVATINSRYSDSALNTNN